MYIFKWNSTLVMSNSKQQFKKKLNGKIRVELDIPNVEFCLKLDINNVKFQNSSILLHSLKNCLFDYIV